MRDMAPPKDRSIRNIPVSPAHRRAQVTRFEAEEYEEEEREPRQPRKRRKGNRLFALIAVVVIILCAVAGLLLSTLFAGASVTVYPRTADVPASVGISAQPNAPSGTLAYQVMTITSSGTTSVTASGTQNVSKQASGVITITNNYNAETQRLIANTRFEAPDGKIYRIHDSVTVPGMTGTTPGKATITVYADSPGDTYNRGATHFTIPGFKGDPRYTKFYADADSLSGGFVGTQAAVAAGDLSAAKTVMEGKLQEAVQSSLASQIPTGFMIVNNSFQYAFTDMRQTPDTSGKVSLSEGVTATAAIVRTSDLAAAVARQAAVDNYNGEAVAFADLTKITAGVDASSTKAPVGKLDITVTGGSKIVWQYDKNALKAALVGKKKDMFESIVTSFHPAIVRAEAKVRPFWQTNFPSNPDKITVTEGAL